ncbi:hypothetical protein TWF730_003247 [Orbilia blumenaviensis]|uniref:Uncharacterized protein n=1 Tax=Orbilia blumenaviensis TaxID=1796055 RepID=A0AAV9U5E7_9PEZI
MDNDTRPEDRAAANVSAAEMAATDTASSETAKPLEPVEKTDILYFPLRYTRIRNYWGFKELAFDDVNNDPQEVQVEYCESDPKVYDLFIKSTFIPAIVGLYEPISKTLVHRADIIKIKEMNLPNGPDTIWSLVYKQPRNKMGWWDNLAWASRLILKDEFSPMLYIEDLEKGRYNDTLYDVLWWSCKDTIFPQKKEAQEGVPQFGQEPSTTV